MDHGPVDTGKPATDGHWTADTSLLSLFLLLPIQVTSTNYYVYR